MLDQVISDLGRHTKRERFLAQEANNPSRLPGEEATLGERLKAARLRAGWEQSQVAKHVEVHKVTVSKWERDVQMPSGDLIFELASFYGVSPEYLLRGQSVTENVSRGTSRASAAGPGPLRTADEVAEWGAPALNPRHARNLPLSVREYLAEFHVRLVKGGASEDEIDEAMALLRSPDVFSYFKGGKLAEYNEEDVLDGMRSLAEDVVIPRLQKLGRKVK
jgi:transcriptional regulator with XRE-family HTH domain